MAWKVFISTFGAIFLAELADKTQIVGIGMTSKTGKPLIVWLGSITAYIIVTALSVLLGTVIGKYIRPEIIRYIGGSVFILIGILMFFGKL